MRKKTKAELELELREAREEIDNLEYQLQGAEEWGAELQINSDKYAREAREAIEEIYFYFVHRLPDKAIELLAREVEGDPKALLQEIIGGLHDSYPDFA